MDPRRQGAAFWQNKCVVLERENAELKKQVKDMTKKINLLLKKASVSSSKRVSSPPGGDVDSEEEWVPKRGRRATADGSGSGSVKSRKKLKLDKENVQILIEPPPDVPEELMKTYAQLENAEKFVHLLISHLDKKTVLTCRLTCRRWNTFIRNFFENHPLTLPLAVPAPPPIKSSSNELFRGITVTPSNIQKLYKHLQQWTKLNPAAVERPAFLSRNLTLSPELGKGSTAAFAFFQKVNHLLETFGILHDVWYLTIVVQPEPEDLDMAPAPNVYYRWVQNCLVKMKNLKSLTLVGELKPCDDDLDEKELAIQMRPFKLPAIPSLEYLCLGIQNLPRMVEEQFFIKYASQLKKLKVSLETVLKCREVTERQLEENLRELVVDVDGENEERCVGFLLNILKAPKLQKLTLNMYEMTEEQVVGCSKKFEELMYLKIECVQVIKGEGEKVVVNGGGEGTVPAAGGGKMKLLEINDDGVETYDFLKDLQSLEYLKVRGSSKGPVGMEGGGVEEGEGEGTGVDLREWMYGDEEKTKVYQSRIWEILENLKEFEFMDEDPTGEEATVIRRYTREGYNKACERAEEEAQKFKMVMDDVKEKDVEDGRKEDWKKVLDEVKKKGEMEEDEVQDEEENEDGKMEEDKKVENGNEGSVGEKWAKLEDQESALEEMNRQAKKKADEAAAAWDF